jgi:vanillate O-demethylase monooxygenase subunit
MVGEELQCPYHGWQFAHDGTCTLIPALGADATVPPRAHLHSHEVREAYGLVWVALEAPSAPLIDIPEHGAEGIVAAWLPATRIECGAAQFIDNFLDIAHFPYVHAGTFGVGEPTIDADGEVTSVMEPYAVETIDDGTGLRVRYDHHIANREDPGVASGERPLVQPRRMEYVYRVHFAARLRLDMPMTGIENTVIVALAPIDERSTMLFSALLRNDLDHEDDVRARDAVAFELEVLAEDLVILEKFEDPRFPLDATLQVHTRADRNTVEFRRLLAAHLAPTQP